MVFEHLKMLELTNLACLTENVFQFFLSGLVGYVANKN